MTDKELATFGERLYEAVLLTPLPAGTILGLATAIRYNAPWADLPRSLRFAVFKIAAACLGEPADQADDKSGQPPPAPSAHEQPPGTSTDEQSMATTAAGAAPTASGGDSGVTVASSGDESGA
jgi:hypothetical protein